VLSGDFIVIWGGVEDHNNGGDLTITLLGGLTGTLTTRQSDDTASWAGARIGTASVTGSGNIQGKVVGTVATGSVGFNVGVWVYRAHGGVGTSGKTHTSATSPSLALTVASNSAIACCLTDWTATNTARTYRQVNSTNPTERGHFADGTTWHWDAFDYADTGAGGGVTVGETAPASQTLNLLAVEILGGADTTVSGSSAASAAAVAGQVSPYLNYKMWL
jgi:hypothetical protein